MKECNTCHLRKPLSAFSINRSAKDHRQAKCKTCKATYQANLPKRESTEELRARRAEYARRYRKKKKMAEEEAEKLDQLAEKITEKIEIKVTDQKLADFKLFRDRYPHLFK